MSVYVLAAERSVLPFLSTSGQRSLSRHIVFGRRAQTQSASIRPLLSSTSRRSFAASSTETSKETQQGDGKVILSTPRIQKLYDEIVQLPVREVNIMGALVLQILGQKVYPGEFGHHTPLPEGMMEAAAAAAAEQQEEVVEEAKTIFDVKLLGFDAKAKIKVIKEVRAITGLGLKEAKAKVESAPTVISKDVKQEQADELKEKLEAIGAEVEIL